MIAFYWFVESFRRSNFVVQYFKGEAALWRTPIIPRTNRPIYRCFYRQFSISACLLIAVHISCFSLNPVTYVKSCISIRAYIELVIRIRRKSVSIPLDGWRPSAIFTTRRKWEAREEIEPEEERRERLLAVTELHLFGPLSRKVIFFQRGKLSTADGLLP